MVNVDYLIKKYAEATQRVKEYWDDRDNRNYWQGGKEALYIVLSENFNGWAVPGSVGYYVYYEQMSYPDALMASKENLKIKEI